MRRALLLCAVLLGAANAEEGSGDVLSSDSDTGTDGAGIAGMAIAGVVIIIGFGFCFYDLATKKITGTGEETPQAAA